MSLGSLWLLTRELYNACLVLLLIGSVSSPVSVSTQVKKFGSNRFVLHTAIKQQRYPKVYPAYEEDVIIETMHAFDSQSACCLWRPLAAVK
jgi:hypothetical protein